MKVDETNWLESRRDADESEETDCVTSIVEVEDETDCAEVRREESEVDTEGWCEVSDETMLLDSEEEHWVEHVAGFETDCSETHAEVWADGLEGAEPYESVRMSVGDVGM